MHARYARSIVESSRSYVCLSCRLHNATVSNRRHQHTESSNNTEQHDAADTSASLSNRIRAFLSREVAQGNLKTTETKDAVETSRKPDEVYLFHGKSAFGRLVLHSELTLLYRQASGPNHNSSFANERATQDLLQRKFQEQRQKDLAALQSSRKSRHFSEHAVFGDPIASKPKEASQTQGETLQNLSPAQRRKLRRRQREKVTRTSGTGPNSFKSRSKSEGKLNKLKDQDDAPQARGSEQSSALDKPGVVPIETGQSQKEEPTVGLPEGNDAKADEKGRTKPLRKAKSSSESGTETVNDMDPPKAVLKKTKLKKSTSSNLVNAGKTDKGQIKKKVAKDEDLKEHAKDIRQRELGSGESGKRELLQRLTSQITLVKASLKKNAGEGHLKELRKIRKEFEKQKEKLFRETSADADAKDAIQRKFNQFDAYVGKVAASKTKSKRLHSAIEKTNAFELEIKAIEVEQPPVPSLAYGLTRVLFNPGVYQLQDPRSRVYNFDPYLQNIMPVAEFDFNALKEYITSSKDESLKAIAQQNGKRYVGSTSSMTSILSHFHFLLSQWRPINTSMLSKSFPVEHSNFTELQRCPSAIFLRWRDGTYAIDADKQFASANILSMLGKSMEKLLTLKTEEYEKYRKSNPTQVSKEEQVGPESYHYSTMGDFLMRSQLDAHDPRLPGTGMFDLKTRAVVSVRMDVQNFEQGVGYQIKGQHGAYESYEREYYDMIRAAFLKYSMQVRMGRMDGIFVAYHNVERIFGFQYVSLNEMDSTIHGQWDTTIGDQEFTLSLDLLNKMLDKATKRFPETSLRIHIETRDAATPFMYIFAEPVTEDEVTEIQSSNAAKIQDFESRILGLSRGDAAGETHEVDPKWADIQASVQEAMDKDELGLDDSTEEKSEGSDGHESDEKGVSREGFTKDDSDSGATAADDAADVAEEEGDEDENGVEERDEGNENDEDDDEASESQDEDEDEGNSEEGEQDEDIRVTEVMNEQAAEAYEQKTSACVLGREHGCVLHDRNSSHERAVDDSANDAEDSVGSSKPSSSDILDQPAVNDEQPIATTLQDSTTPKHDEQSSSETTGEKQQFLSFEKTEGFQTQADTPFIEEIDQVTAGDGGAVSRKDILAMTLTLRNKVNNAFVLRPENLTSTDKWSIEYSLVEVADKHRAWSLYEACQARRKKKLDAPMPEEDAEVINYYIKNLRKLSQQGREWRREMDEKDSDKPVRVLWRKKGES